MGPKLLKKLEKFIFLFNANPKNNFLSKKTYIDHGDGRGFHRIRKLTQF